MPKERKRKFLVIDPGVLNGHQGFPIVQGYLVTNCPLVEVRTFGNFAFLCVGSNLDQLSGNNFEYPIPVEDALAMLECHCASRFISKTRHLIPHGDEVLEVDVFAGKLAGLVIAEAPHYFQSGSFELPAWLGAEVTENPDFDDFALAHRECPPPMTLQTKTPN